MLSGLLGCQRPLSDEVSVEPTSTILPRAEATVTGYFYPGSPEEVVRAFVIAYPSNPVYALQFLSPDYISRLDGESVNDLLPEKGDATGFMIENGSTSVEKEQSYVQTSIGYSDRIKNVLFNLVIIDGRWFIDKITW